MAANVSYPVIALPGPVLCGKCFHAMRFEDLKRGAKSVVGCCMTWDCEQKDIPLVYPLPEPIMLQPEKAQ